MKTKTIPSSYERVVLFGIAVFLALFLASRAHAGQAGPQQKSIIVNVDTGGPGWETYAGITSGLVVAGAGLYLEHRRRQK